MSVVHHTIKMQSSTDSDSDTDERVENVQFILVKSKSNQQETDENYAYKRRLGDLIFNANFETGNLGYVEQIDEYRYDLMVRPDVANPRRRLWFNFTVSNQRPNQVNISQRKLNIQGCRAQLTNENPLVCDLHLCQSIEQFRIVSKRFNTSGQEQTTTKLVEIE